MIALTGPAGRRIGRCAAAALALALAGCVGGGAEFGFGQDPSGPEAYFASYDVVAPDESVTTVCHGYGCRYKTKVRFTEAEIETVRAAFATEATDPAAERAQIATTIGQFERKVGKLIGTENDPGGVLENQHIGDPTRQDCIDEAATTSGYLMLLQNNGILKFHTVREPRARGIFIDGRWQHFTAVVEETGTGSRYAIDSWFRANGQPAVVMTLTDWLFDYTPASAKQLPEGAT